jgi:hypothetical protein
MSNFIGTLHSFKSYVGEFEESEALGLFFHVLVKFNKERPVNPKIKNDIEKYFEHRWSNNLNQAISDSQDVQTFDECPMEVKEKILMFLFENYLQKFRFFFCLRNFEITNRP